MSEFEGIPVRAPEAWSQRWFLGWYRDVFLKLARSRPLLKSTGALHLEPLAADPSDLEDGDFWLNSTDSKLRVRIGGSTVDLN